MLDWDSLYNEANARAMAGGKKRFYDNRVQSLRTQKEGGKFTVYATVRGDRDYTAKVQFDEQGGLYDYDCDCTQNAVTDGPCRHVVALALAYENKFPAELRRGSAETVARRSDASVRALIEKMGSRRRVLRTAEEGAAVHVVPSMQIGADGRLSLKFTVGAKRMYTVKDVDEFAANWETGAEKRYGVELTVAHEPSSFDELSAKLAAFICGSCRERAELRADARAAGDGKRDEWRDELRLTAGGVDEFLQMYAGKTVACSDASVKQGMRMICEKPNAPDFGLKLSRVAGGGYVTESKVRAFRVLYGKRFRYVVTENCVFPVTEAYAAAMLPLVSALAERGRLFVAESDMSQFYNSVLTRVLAFAEIDAPDVNLSVFEAAPLELKVYLSSAGDGGVQATVHASYDGETDVDIMSDDAGYPFVRDFESESAFLRVLRKYFPAYPQLAVTDEGDVYTLLREGLRELMACAEVFLSDELRKMKVKKPPRIKVGVRLKSDLLDVDLSAEEYTAAQLHEILDAYRQKRNYVRLTDGSFVDLVDPSVAALAAVSEAATWEGDRLTLPTYYAPYVDRELKTGYFHLERSDDFKNLVKDLENAGESLAPVPASLASTLRNYQKTGYRWLKTLARFGFGGILADDMGLGKTLQIIALFLSEQKAGQTSIVVCPTTLVLNWVHELQTFAPSLAVLAVTGNGDERKSMTDGLSGYDVVVTSYELLRRDVSLYKDTEFAFAVLDEAQYIKNPQTKNALAVKSLRARRRFALTGTPVENSLAELWSIFDFLMPGYLFSYAEFRDTLETAIVHGDEEAADRLRRLIRPFLLRRLKTNVLKELPPKTESDVLCPLAGEQRDLYVANLAQVRESVASAGEKVNKVVVLSLLTKLRQICCAPQLVYPAYEGNSSKVDACLELVRSAAASGHKVLVFSQFTSLLDILRTRLVQEGIRHYLLQGDTPKVERVKLVSRFNEDATQVFLISLKAGGTGLNLTGADVVIHCDPWWNESVMHQATDRAYRIGQDKPVQVYRLIMQDSIEQRIMALQQKKTALSDMVMNAASTSHLKAEDILALLG